MKTNINGDYLKEGYTSPLQRLHETFNHTADSGNFGALLAWAWIIAFFLVAIAINASVISSEVR